MYILRIKNGVKEEEEGKNKCITMEGNTKQEY